jgi:hypothetical protein
MSSRRSTPSFINLLEGRAEPIKRDLAGTATPALNNFRRMVIIPMFDMADLVAAMLAVTAKQA